MMANLLLAIILSAQQKLLGYFEHMFLCLNKAFLFNNFVILQKGVLSAKNGDFALLKKGREKTRMFKVAKWAQKNVTKKRKVE